MQKLIALVAKAVGAGLSIVGASTAPEDTAELLREVADMIEGGGNSVLWILAAVFLIWAGLDIVKWFSEKKPAAREATPSTEAVDYITAVAIINSYIDPDRTMHDRVRLVARTEILKRFEDVLGSKIGENYNGEILNQWMQKNAARMLVQHRGDIR